MSVYHEGVAPYTAKQPHPVRSAGEHGTNWKDLID
jgi:hypothetical protein